jgi:hypothetical protein
MSIPSPNSEPERYQGRPLVLILENYILDVVGELPLDKQASIRQIVQRVWSGGDDWKATVRRELQFGDDLDEHLRQMWTRNQQIACEQKVELQPVSFAKMVVDQNFAALIA